MDATILLKFLETDDKMKKQNKVFTISAIIITFIIVGLVISINIISKVEATTYKIGVIAPLTGEAATYGLAAKAGLDFAVEELNIKGGVLGKKIELVYEDSMLDNKRAVSIMNKFVSVDDFDVVIVADGSGPTLAVAPIAEANKVLMIGTLGSTPELNEAGDYVFRTVPSDSAQAKEMARIVASLGLDNVALFYVNDAYGVGIKNKFEEDFSGRIVASESFEHESADFRTQLIKIKDADPEVMILVARKELPTILKQMKELNINLTIIGSETTKDADLIQKAGSAAEGMLSVYYAKAEDYVNYKDRFVQKTGKEVPVYSEYSYDGVMVLAKAIEKAGSFDVETIKSELYNIRYLGATGVVSFDESGEVKDKPFSIFKVKNGNFVEIEI